MRMRVSNVSIALCLLSIALIACGQRRADWQGTIEEVDGITYVKNPKEGIWDS